MTLEEWSRKKNSGHGPSVFERCTPGFWTPAEDLRVTATRLPGVPEDLPATLLRGLLTEAECRELIAAVPSSGPGFLGRDEVFQLYHDRVVKYRFLTSDEELAERMFGRLRPYLPQELDGGRVLRLNPAFRFVHHDRGGHQAAHVDGREPVQPQYDAEAGGWVQSRLTLQCYLNHDFTGGELALVEPDADGPGVAREKYVHRPRTGDGIVFYQERLVPPSERPPYEVLHEARSVLSGNKYAMRTMVDYVFPDAEMARMTNIKDDRPE